MGQGRQSDRVADLELAMRSEGSDDSDDSDDVVRHGEDLPGLAQGRSLGEVGPHHRCHHHSEGGSSS